MMTDPIADFLTRIRNALMIKRPQVYAPASKMLVQIAGILSRYGMIQGFRIEGSGIEAELILELKYDAEGKPVIEGLKRLSTPGLRVYRGAQELPPVRGGMGLGIISTSKGIMTFSQAKRENMGGEVICLVW